MLSSYEEKAEKAEVGTCEEGGDGAEQIEGVRDRGDQELGQGIKVDREVGAF